VRDAGASRIIAVALLCSADETADDYIAEQRQRAALPQAIVMMSSELLPVIASI
jgi:hypothetical protein